jgi:hypothetical protein
MTKSVNARLVTACLITTLTLVGLISCGKKQDEAAPMKSPSKEQIALVDAYQKTKSVGMTGNVAEFRKMRDSLTMATIDAYIVRIGGKVDSARVTMWGTQWPNVTGLPLVEDSSNGEWRRLTFTIIGSRDKTGKEKYVYPVVLMRKNGSTWKVSNAILMGGDKFDHEGKIIPFKDVPFPPMFSIPPVFDELFK